MMDGIHHLPVPYRDRTHLPVHIAGLEPQHVQANVLHADWSTFASQRHMRDLALNTTTGDVWLATGGGVLHWAADHRSFTRYASEHGLLGNATTAIAVDGNGRVWVAYEQNGLSYLDGDRWVAYKPLDNSTVSCLSISNAGQLWVGTTQNIYAIGNPDEDPAFAYPFEGASPHKLVVVSDDLLWLCNAQGIFHFAHGDWQPRVYPGILTLAIYNDQLWLGTIRGLAQLNMVTGQISRREKLPEGEVTAFTPTANGLWAACGRRVGLITEAGWIPLGGGKRHDSHITRIVPVNDEEVWIGTHSGLLRATSTDFYPQQTLTAPDVIGPVSSDPQSPPPSTLSNLIQAIAVQHSPQCTLVWLGTPKGLFRLETSRGEWYHQPFVWDTRAILTDPTCPDKLWIASWANGLLQAKVKPTFQGLVPKLEIKAPMLTLAQGIDSTYWATGPDGLYQTNKEGSWNSVLPNERLPQGGWIQVILQVTNTHLWLGTSHGLLNYNPTTDTLVAVQCVLGSTDIRAMCATPTPDRPDLVWIGTNFGLWPQIQTMQGPNNFSITSTITALAWDGNNQKLWVGTDRGLFSIRQWDNGQWKIEQEFTSKNSGLVADRVTALVYDATPQGKHLLWIGTVCGLNCFVY